jgi:hypothetical protein
MRFIFPGGAACSSAVPPEQHRRHAGAVPLEGLSTTRESKLMTIDADKFIHRFLLHLLPSVPSGFRRIRHFGFLANAHRSARWFITTTSRQCDGVDSGAVIAINFSTPIAAARKPSRWIAPVSAPSHRRLLVACRDHAAHVRVPHRPLPTRWTDVPRSAHLAR